MGQALTRFLPILGFSAALVAGAACMPGCSSDDDEPAEPVVALHDASRARRVFQPPPGEVRPVPPHAIHGQGVGPYVLGLPLKRILGLLPHGPRVVLLQLDDLFDYSVVRAEGDSMVIGVEQPSGVTFLTVLDKEIARIESGVGVGTPVAELREAMGEELRAPGLVMDPRMLAFRRLPNARFVLDEARERVGAVIVRRDDGEPGRGPEGMAEGRQTGMSHGKPDGKSIASGKTAGKSELRLDGKAPGKLDGKSGGKSPGTPEGKSGSKSAGKSGSKSAGKSGSKPEGRSDGKSGGKPDGHHEGQSDGQESLEPGCHGLLPEPEILQVARLTADRAEQAQVVYGCFSGSPEAVVAAGDRLLLVGGEPGKLRRLATHNVTGVVHLAVVDLDADGRHEIAIISESMDERERVVHVELWRVETGRLVRVAFQDVYRLSSVGAGWVGAKLDQIDFLVELRVNPDALKVTGLYVQRHDHGVAMVAPLMAAHVPVRRRRGALLTSPPGQDEIAGSQGAPGLDAETGPSRQAGKVISSEPRAADARAEDEPKELPASGN